MVRALKDDHTGRMTGIITGFQLGNPLEHLDLSRLDREQMSWWIEALEEAESDARILRRTFEAVLAGDVRTCPECGLAVTGRADQTYCSARCRQRAKRAANRG